MATLLTPVDLTKLTLAASVNSLVLGGKIDWSYTDKFSESDNPIGASTNIRRPVLGTINFNNIAFTSGAGNITENFSTLIVNTTATAFMTFSECDAALRCAPKDFMRRYGSRIGAQIGAQVDSKLFDAIVNAGANLGTTGFTGSGQPVLGSSAVQSGAQTGAQWLVAGSGNSGTMASPGTLTSADLLLAKQYLDDSAAPDYDRYGILTPKASNQISNAQLTLFNAQTAIAAIYMKGRIGQFAGIEFAMSQSPVAHTNGAAWGSATISTTAIAATNNSTWSETGSLTVNAFTASTVNAGDMFTIGTAAAGVVWVNPLTKAPTTNLVQFTVVTAIGTAATTNQTVVASPAIILSGPYQNAVITGATSTTAAVTLQGAASATYQESVVFQRDAIAAAAPKLYVPKGHDFADYERDGESGIGMRVVRSYDSIGAAPGASGTPSLITRMDTVFGIKIVRPEWIVRIRTA